MPISDSTRVAQLIDDLPLPETIANPYPLYAQLREHTPMFGYQDYPPGTVPGQDDPVRAWVLMKYEDVRAAAQDHETFSSRDPLQEQSSAPSLMLVNHDNPEHDRLREFVSHPFAFRQIESLRPWITSRIEEMLDSFSGRKIEVVGTLTSIIPARVMMRLLGCPDADHERCRDWANAFMLSADLSADERQASNQALVAYFIERVNIEAAKVESGQTPSQGLIGHLLTNEVEGERLTHDEVIRFCLTLVVAGAETTTFLLANLLYNMATMPDVLDSLSRNNKLVLPFINETLRHSGPPQRLFRIATREVELQDATIQAGDWVALFFGAANHDPAEFPDPEKFDLTRKNLRMQLSMGVGLHQCLGFAVAKMEAAAMIDVILRQVPNLTLADPMPTPQTASLLTHSFESLTLQF
ncbi:MAG: cytochrome P450 [Pseudomonadota bacterium]